MQYRRCSNGLANRDTFSLFNPARFFGSAGCQGAVLCSLLPHPRLSFRSVRPKARRCSVNHRGVPRRRQSSVPRSSLLCYGCCCVCVEKTNATSPKIPPRNACTQCPHSANVPSVFKATQPSDSRTSARLEARTVSPFASAKGPSIVPAVPCAHTFQPLALST